MTREALDRSESEQRQDDESREEWVAREHIDRLELEVVQRAIDQSIVEPDEPDVGRTQKQD